GGSAARFDPGRARLFVLRGVLRDGAHGLRQRVKEIAMAQVLMKDLNKKYDEVHAVKDVNLHIRDKEFVVLVGPSGCGKSTTLRMVAGLEEITSGEISIGERVVNDLPPKDRDIAMVFQNYALYPHMTVYDNMAFGLKMRKFPKAEIAKRVHEAAEILGIQELLKPLELYSKPANRFVAGFIGSPAMNFIEVGIKDGGALWAETAGFRVKIPPDRAERLKSYAGQPVTVGIRPEDLRLATGGDSSDHTFDAVVDVVEPLGSEILLDVKAGSNTMVARVEPTVRVKVHEPIRLALNAERLHFFDKKSEAAI